MRVIGLAVVLVLSLILAPLPIGAQPPTKTPHIGVLFPAEPTSPTEPNALSFRQGLRDLGYVEGQNIFVEYRYAHGNTARHVELATELVQLKVDVIVAGGSSIFAARDVTKTTPLVSVGVGDPVVRGLVASHAHPGGNITGLSMVYAEGLSGKWVQLLKEAAPRVSHMGFLNDANYPLSETGREVETAVTRLGLKFEVLNVRELHELDSILAAMNKEPGGGLIVPGQPLFFPHRSRIHEFAAKHRLPAVYGWRVFVDAGGLMSYGPSLADLWRRAANYVDRIVKGAKPADMPMEQPTKFELVINLKTAKALGLTIPQSLLIRADEIIQ